MASEDAHLWQDINYKNKANPRSFFPSCHFPVLFVSVSSYFYLKKEVWCEISFFITFWAYLRKWSKGFLNDSFPVNSRLSEISRSDDKHWEAVIGLYPSWIVFSLWDGDSFMGSSPSFPFVRMAILSLCTSICSSFSYLWLIGTSGRNWAGPECGESISCLRPWSHTKEGGIWVFCLVLDF